MKSMITLALLGLCLNAAAYEPESHIQCTNDGTMAVNAATSSVFDLQEGKYKPDDAAGYFCSEYTVTATKYNTCNGNITALRLNCISENKSWDFSCGNGNCTTTDGKRSLTIDKDFSNWAKYEANGKKVILRYSEPCN